MSKLKKSATVLALLVLMIVSLIFKGLGIGYSYEVPVYSETMFMKDHLIYPNSSLLRGGQKSVNWSVLKEQVSSHYGQPPNDVNTSDDGEEVWIYKEYSPKFTYLGIGVLLSYDSCEPRNVKYTFLQDKLVKTELQMFKKGDFCLAVGS